MKEIKFISFLLLLSILVLIGHNLIPHHHHVAAAGHPSSHECPTEDHDHQNDEGPYCHAFNDISFVKYNSSGLPDPADISWEFISNDQGPVDEPDFTYQNVIPLLKPPPLLAELSGILSLRGPPVRA